MSRIYMVDDEPMIRLGLKQMVKEYNRFEEIRTYTDGSSALQAILAEPPELVITDICMPRMDGLELCRLIREHKLRTKIIVLSGCRDFSSAQKCISYGVKEYMLKPLKKKELYSALDKIVSERSGGSFSFSRFEEWLDLLKEALWLTDGGKLGAMLAQGRKEFFESGGGWFPQPQRTAKDGLKLLVKKLNTRGMYTFECAPSILDALRSDRNAFDAFERQIYDWLEQLLGYRGGGQVHLLEASMDFIEQHFCEDLTLEAVAERIGLSPTYFSHYFKKMTGETFVQYRLRKRIEQAKRLLAIPHYKIIDVVTEIGYDSYPHFTRVFKKATGCSPTEYRTILGIK